jgi:hypothetical protein
VEREGTLEKLGRMNSKGVEGAKREREKGTRKSKVMMARWREVGEAEREREMGQRGKT